MKRKFESKILEPATKTSKVEVWKKKKNVTKASTKAEVLLEYKALEMEYKKLAEENVKHIETISILQNKVNSAWFFI